MRALPLTVPPDVLFRYSSNLPVHLTPFHTPASACSPMNVSEPVHSAAATFVYVMEDMSIIYDEPSLAVTMFRSMVYVPSEAPPALPNPSSMRSAPFPSAGLYVPASLPLIVNTGLLSADEWLYLNNALSPSYAMAVHAPAIEAPDVNLRFTFVTLRLWISI